MHDQRLPELRAEAFLAGRALQDAADAGVGPVEELTVLELALPDSEDEQVSVDVGGVGGGGGEVRHGAVETCVRGTRAAKGKVATAAIQGAAALVDGDGRQQ